VAQHLDSLKPTAANKMYNAELVERRSPGIPVEPRRWPSNSKKISRNTKIFKPIVGAATAGVRLFGTYTNPSNLSDIVVWNYAAKVGTVRNDVLLSALRELRLVPDDHLAPDLRWLTSLAAGVIERWLVIFPQHVSVNSRRKILGYPPLSVYTRTRLRPDYYGAVSEKAHRGPLEVIKHGGGHIGDDSANALVRPNTGGILVYPTVDRPESGSAPAIPGATNSDLDDGQVTLAFHLVAPAAAVGDDRRLIVFSTKDSTRKGVAIVDRQS
jgi:hypothetical protein